MQRLAAPPFKFEAPVRAQHDEHGTDLLQHQLKGLRAQTESFSRSAPGDAAQLEPPAVCGSTVGLLAPIELPSLQLLDATAAAPATATAKGGGSEEAADAADAEAQQQCFAACFGGRREAVQKLVRRRVQCEVERARVSAVAAAEATASNGASADGGLAAAAAASAISTLDAEILRLNASLASLPPPQPPPDAPEGIDPADAAALRGGDTAVPPPSAPLPSSNEVCSSQQPAATAAEARTLPPRHQLPTCTLWLPVRVPTALPPSHSHIAPPRPLAFVCVCRWRPCYAAASACATALRRCTPTWVRSPRATARTHGACYTRLRGVRPRSCCPQTLQDRRRCPRRLRAIRR